MASVGSRSVFASGRQPAQARQRAHLRGPEVATTTVSRNSCVGVVAGPPPTPHGRQTHCKRAPPARPVLDVRNASTRLPGPPQHAGTMSNGRQASLAQGAPPAAATRQLWHRWGSLLLWRDALKPSRALSCCHITGGMCSSGSSPVASSRRSSSCHPGWLSHQCCSTRPPLVLPWHSPVPHMRAHHWLSRL